ncbi:EAL domain-containing protein [Clostridium sp. Ade.TY]|uniref:bifunctional diguanylate cyclase/phosphodiesterase n=1 Tax=Clostridium sp. Ade.TY TaxID=1391647 RepID=UPI0003FCAA05|nr:EAL domain-containing protein [Clostridium sp. Ade.TY]
MKIIRELRAFFAINLILVFTLLMCEYIFSRAIINRIDEKCYLSYSQQIEKLSKGTFDGLNELVEDFATNEALIKLMDKKEPYEKKEKNIMNTIRYAKGLLIATSFVKSIDIIDKGDKELYSSTGEHYNFDMETRPWFKEAYKESLAGKKVIMTPMHKDFFNGRYTVAIVSFIKNGNNKIIGCVILNTYMDALTKYMENLYGDNGNVKIYVKLLNGNYYGYSDGIKTLDEIKSNKNNFIVQNKDVLFAYNKNSTLLHRTMSKVNRVNLFMFLIFVIATIITFFIVKKKILESIIFNISKLKNILKQLNKYDEKVFESKKGFEQLDFIVNAFDNAINEKAKEYIQYDSLTKVLNRRGLEEVFNKEIKGEESVAIIFIDLNKFKNINDVYGHLIGDQFLKEFSELLKKAFLGKGLLSRISGDEFIVLYKNFSTDKELKDFYNKNVVDLFKRVKLINNKFSVSFSAGVAVYPKDGTDLSDLIKKSDYMMYTNKKKGILNELVFFDDEVYKEIEEEETISIELGQAIKNKELTMKYQPIVDRNKKIIKVEALMRWNNKKLGNVPPDKFITIAEENRDIIKIGYWAINKICQDINTLKEYGIDDLIVNVNVSAIQLLENNFAYKVKLILEKNRISCNKLCIEITESVMIEEDEVSLENLSLLKKFGFKLSLDDFGTGYTSFAYLKKFKGESLKIDKTLLDDAKDDEYRIIRSIKEIGNELDFKTVIEGVETKKQFIALKNIGCDLFQGYYFSKPIDLDELKSLIKKH